MRPFSRSCLVLGLLALACHGRPRSSGADPSATGAGLGKSVAAFDLTAGVPESVSGGLFQPPASRTYVALARAVERIADDADVGGAFVKFGGTSLDFAQTEELGALFEKLKQKGKPVVCHAHVLSNSTAAFALRGAYPNPFNPATAVRLDLPEDATVALTVFDVLGRRVASVPAQPLTAGAGRVLRFEAGALASGLYVYRVEARLASGTVHTATGRFTVVR